MRTSFVVLPSLAIETNSTNRLVLVERFPWLIGSGAHSDLRLDDRSVSRSHALLIWRNDLGGIRLIDLNSTNGTFVNGRRVRESTLISGQRIAIGAVCMTYRLQSSAVLADANSSTFE